MYNAIIIGAGFSGIDAAIQLKKKGIHNFIILEKAASLGGTWRENTYPGARCDVESVLYSYSYEPNPDWDWKWSEQSQILQYMESTAKKYEVAMHIHFQKELVAAHWQETEGYWNIQTKDGVNYQTKVLITAIGQLHHPKVPNLKDSHIFKGHSWHSAQWNHEVSLKGKRIGVIGNGASAVQLIPEVAKEAKSMTVFQRTPNWILPKKDRLLKNWEKALLKQIPFIGKLGRFRIWLRNGTLYNVLIGKTVWMRKLQEWLSKKHLEKSISDKQLSTQLLPTYPMGTKRLLISENFYETLAKDHVQLSTSSIAKITPTGLLTQDGQQHDLDIIIYATGFKTNPFLLGLDIKGRQGTPIKTVWKEEPKNYLGMTINGFPNFFMMYGPNINLGSNSMLIMIEAQGKYIAECVTSLKKNNWKAIEVKSDVLNKYYEEIQQRLNKMLWANHENSWYKSENGIITNNWPGRTWEYIRRAKKVNYSDYHVYKD